MKTQPYTFPAGLFHPERYEGDRHWSCVRTRPQWEKKLTHWLVSKDIPHFLPVYERETISYRKRRKSVLPLFSGYVFVEGAMSKTALGNSAAVAYILCPSCPNEVRQLSAEIRDLWRGLTSGINPLPVSSRDLKTGQRVRITAGPMMGTEGCIQRWGHGGRLILSVALLGGAVSVEVPDSCLIEPFE
jgi:transcription antitermination factor NusG